MRRRIPHGRSAWLSQSSRRRRTPRIGGSSIKSSTRLGPSTRVPGPRRHRRLPPSGASSSIAPPLLIRSTTALADLLGRAVAVGRTRLIDQTARATTMAAPSMMHWTIGEHGNPGPVRSRANIDAASTATQISRSARRSDRVRPGSTVVTVPQSHDDVTEWPRRRIISPDKVAENVRVLQL